MRTTTDENHNAIQVEDEAVEVELSEGLSSPGASWLLSGIYCMIVVILSVVICSTYHITDDISETTVDCYFILLYAIGSIWLIGFKPLATSCTSGNRRFREVKSSHTSNKWLKAVLVVFGVAIIIKDILDFLTYFQYPDNDCRKPIYFITPVAQVIFVVCEVNFLFRYSKIHLQDHRQICRFGTMHVMATDLSIWMLVIIDEAMEHLDLQKNQEANDIEHVESVMDELSTADPHVQHISTTHNLLFHNDLEYLLAAPGSFANEVHGECECNTTYCDAVEHAHVFLYPFLIEFSLVASCMIYIVWKNVDTLPSHTITQVKPVYRFYKSYTGFVLGGATVIATIVVLVVINNIPEEISDPSYNTEKNPTLIILNTFMVVTELAMLGTCIFGLILFKMHPRPVLMEVNVDVVLLMGTLTGCAILDILYAFSVYVSIISDDEWIWGAIYPIVDLTQCIVQVALLLWGLSRQSNILERRTIIARNHSASPSQPAVTGFTNDCFEAELSVSDCEDVNGNFGTYNATDSSASSSGISSLNSGEELQETTPTGAGIETCDASTVNAHDIGKESTEESEEVPSRERLNIRNAAVFLLIANACIWMFWSLENTAFKVFTYPYQYYTQPGYDVPNIWHTATMFCLPLSLFFRMHSCACLFEVWSFT